jgi:hypothetical protein
VNIWKAILTHLEVLSLRSSGETNEDYKREASISVSVTLPYHSRNEFVNHSLSDKKHLEWRMHTCQNIVTCYTIQKSCFHRAVPKRAEESQRKPKRADESRRKPKWAEPTKGRDVYTSLFRNGWLHTLRD